MIFIIFFYKIKMNFFMKSLTTITILIIAICVTPSATTGSASTSKSKKYNPLDCARGIN